MVSTRSRAGRPHVHLISLPWTVLAEPSLGLAILKAQLQEDGISCTVSHLNIFLLKYLKAESYEACGNLYAFNDFLFTRDLQGETVGAEQLDALARMTTSTYERVDLRARRHLDPANYTDFALQMRNEIIPAYLDECMDTVDATDSTMVGFTCMFDQTIASLALAKRIKEKYPDRLIVFGGYAIERPVGPLILKCFPYVDVIAYGEGEPKIASLAEASVNRSLLSSIPNIDYRGEDGRIHETPIASPAYNLDDSPVPDYDDWYQDTATLEALHQVRIESEVLPVESSRGCWWGQVSHCVFCGIDDETMKYRAKSADRVRYILAALRAKYGVNNFRFSDYIMPRQYLTTLLPDLVENGEDYLLHWEMKANVRYGDVKIMHEAGIDRVQPGIESFSSSILSKMDKGVRGIQNVLTIRLLMEHDINVYYNILYGFKTDEVDEYVALSEQIPLLYHLKPPGSYVPVLTTRYAPMHVDPARFGIERPLHADPRYAVIFSREYCDQIGFDVDDYCYVFETPYDISRELQDRYDILVYQLYYWFSLGKYRTVQLSYEVSDTGIEFVDSRHQAEPLLMSFGPDHARVHDALTHQILAHKQILEKFDDSLGLDRTQAAIDDLMAARLLYQEGHRFVALALPKACYDRWAELPEQRPIAAWV